jgi:hypothetical protein
MGTVLSEVLGDDFLLVEYVGMYQIHLYVFVRASHAHHVSEVAISKVPTFRTSYSALGNVTPKMLAQRKGGVAVSFHLGGSSFCFVTAHLAAHQGEKGQMLERNRDCARILKELDLRGDGADTCACFDHLVLCGDLNYRLGPPELGDNAAEKEGRKDGAEVGRALPARPAARPDGAGAHAVQL